MKNVSLSCAATLTRLVHESEAAKYSMKEIKSNRLNAPPSLAKRVSWAVADAVNNVYDSTIGEWFGPEISYEQLKKKILAAIPGAVISSEYRPGDSGAHGKNLAIDIDLVPGPGWTEEDNKKHWETFMRIIATENIQYTQIIFEGNHIHFTLDPRNPNKREALYLTNTPERHFYLYRPGMEMPDYTDIMYKHNIRR